MLSFYSKWVCLAVSTLHRIPYSHIRKKCSTAFRRCVSVSSIIYRLKRFRYETILQWKLHHTIFPASFFFPIPLNSRPYNECTWDGQLNAHGQRNTFYVQYILYTYRTYRSHVVLHCATQWNVIVDSFSFFFCILYFVTVNSWAPFEWNHCNVYVQMIAFTQVVTTSRKETNYFSKHSNHFQCIVYNFVRTSNTHKILGRDWPFKCRPIINRINQLELRF